MVDSEWVVEEMGFRAFDTRGGRERLIDRDQEEIRLIANRWTCKKQTR
jgi:hypothetical protein